ncbi:hypothetical protein ACFLRX_08270 [Acidobacteriota bacterium]
MTFNIKLLNLQRKRKKYLTLILDIEPKSKKTTKNKSELQSMIIEKLRKKNWKCIESKVAVELISYTNQQNPPQIEKFAKNIIDIMHKEELLKNKKDKIYLPFKDDKFVKYLRIKYVFFPGKSKTQIKIKPFNSFISDIHFVRTELGLNYNAGKNTRDNWAEYREIIDKKEEYLKVLSKEAYVSMVKMETLDIQKDICDGISITPEIIGLLYPKQGKYAKNFKEIYRNWASMLLDVPIRIHLPGIPLNEDGKTKYKAIYKIELKKQMRKYLANHTIFRNFQAPILVSVFYMPPKRKKKDYKDIDNIMLEYIMPTMNEIFRPPVSIFNLAMEDKCGKIINDLLISNPKSLNGSAIGYEIIELPFNFSTSDTGFIKIGFKIEIEESSVMDYIDEEINKYMEENQYV